MKVRLLLLQLPNKMIGNLLLSSIMTVAIPEETAVRILEIAYHSLEEAKIGLRALEELVIDQKERISIIETVIDELEPFRTKEALNDI